MKSGEEFIEIGPELKHTIRKMIREAIRWQNKKVLFTCRDCCFYQPEVIGGVPELALSDEDEDAMDIEPEESVPESCTLEPTNRLILSKRMPTTLPTCFTYDPLASSFAAVLTLIYSLGVDTMNAGHGWATVVSRLAARQDRFGYLHGVTQRNLERYGTS